MKKNEMLVKYRQVRKMIGWNEKLVLSAGGAMVFYGLRDSTSDIDCDVDAKVYNRYFKSCVIKQGITSPYYNFIDGVSFHTLSKGVEIVTIRDVMVYSIDALLKQKRSMLNYPNRKVAKKEQDELDIIAIERYLQS